MDLFNPSSSLKLTGILDFNEMVLLSWLRDECTNVEQPSRYPYTLQSILALPLTYAAHMDAVKRLIAKGAIKTMNGENGLMYLISPAALDEVERMYDLYGGDSAPSRHLVALKSG